MLTSKNSKIHKVCITTNTNLLCWIGFLLVQLSSRVSSCRDGQNETDFWLFSCQTHTSKESVRSHIISTSLIKIYYMFLKAACPHILPIDIMLMSPFVLVLPLWCGNLNKHLLVLGWTRFDFQSKVLETFRRDFSPYWHESISYLMQI